MPVLGESATCDTCGKVYVTAQGHNFPGPRSAASAHRSAPRAVNTRGADQLIPPAWKVIADDHHRSTGAGRGSSSPPPRPRSDRPPGACPRGLRSRPRVLPLAVGGPGDLGAGRRLAGHPFPACRGRLANPPQLLVLRSLQRQLRLRVPLPGQFGGGSVKLIAILGGSDPDPMTDQDLQDWGGSVDAKSAVGGGKGKTPENVIAAGQAAADVTRARWGRS
jgi:hypothetical protein